MKPSTATLNQDNGGQRYGMKKFHQRGENGDHARHRQPSTIYDVICSNLKLSDSPKKQIESVVSPPPDVVNKGHENNNNENVMENTQENGSDLNGKRPNRQNSGYRNGGRYNGQNRGRRNQYNNGFNGHAIVMNNQMPQMAPQMPMMQFAPMYPPPPPLMMNYPPPGIEIGKNVLAPSYDGNFYNGTIVLIDPYECTVIVEVTATHEHINAFWDSVQLLSVAG